IHALRAIVARALFDAVRARELARAEAQIFDELDARKAAGAFAVACIVVRTIAATRTVNGVIGTAVEQLRSHRYRNAVLGISAVRTRNATAEPIVRVTVLFGGRGYVAVFVVGGQATAGLVHVLAVRAAHATLEVIDQADARFALEGS